MKKKRFTEEQIVCVLQEVERGETIASVCKKHGVSEQSYYRWRKKYGGLGQSDVRRLRALEKENSRLKRLVAERDLEIDAMQEVMRKKY